MQICIIDVSSELNDIFKKLYKCEFVWYDLWSIVICLLPLAKYILLFKDTPCATDTSDAIYNQGLV